AFRLWLLFGSIVGRPWFVLRLVWPWLFRLLVRVRGPILWFVPALVCGLLAARSRMLRAFVSRLIATGACLSFISAAMLFLLIVFLQVFQGYLAYVIYIAHIRFYACFAFSCFQFHRSQLICFLAQLVYLL